MEKSEGNNNNDAGDRTGAEENAKTDALNGSPQPSSSSSSSTLSRCFPLLLLLLSISLATTTPLYTRLRSTALPPPGPLPPLNTKPEFTLQRFLAPIFLLVLALLIPARTQLQKWIVSGVFVPIILHVHWGSLGCGSRSSSHGFALGIYCVFHTYQTLNLLVFSCPRSTFFRVPIHIQRAHVLTRQPIPAKHLDPYPPTLSRRIHWVLELVTTMRYLGWHTPHSKPTTSSHLLRSTSPSLDRARFIRILVVRILATMLLVDFLVWNIRRNDTGFYLPHLLLNRSPHQVESNSQVSFTPDFPAVAIYPNPPTLSLSSYPPWASISLVPAHAYHLSPDQIPYPKYPLLPLPTPSSSQIYTSYIFPAHLTILRSLAQTLAVYAAISGLFSAVSLMLMLISYLIYPSSSSSPHMVAKQLEQSRWFNPAAYPDMFAFSEIEFGTPIGVGWFWTRSWHGLFRRAFLRPWVVLGMGAAGNWVKVLGVFTLSGVLHFWGVRTKVDVENGGGWGCLLFFVVQPLGMVAETIVRGAWTRFIRPMRREDGSAGEKVLRLVEMAVGWVWTLAWFACTSGWFFDEMTWGGVWRVEPTPVSLWQKGWLRWGPHSDEIGGSWGWWEWSEGGAGWGVVL